MQRRRILAAGLLGSGLTLALAFSAPAGAAAAPAMQTYEVTITNLTPGQVMSPVLLATHNSGARLYVPGEAASADLALLAEEGDNSALFGTLSGLSAVHGVESGMGTIAPGGSETITIDAAADARLLSAASMLVTTNDVFAGLDSLILPVNGPRLQRAYLFGYDAGSEANSELCAFIPGPPCMSAGAHDPAPAEGFIAVSNGVRGTGDIDANAYDWRGPVAQIEIRRL